MTDRDETFGIVLAAQRARWWLPRLANDGERAVLMAMVLFVGMDGTASPTAEQLAELVDRSVNGVRRILRGLSGRSGPLVRVGQRPVFLEEEGRQKGGKVHIYSIAPTDRLGDQLGMFFPGDHPDGQVGDSQVITGEVPGDHPDNPQVITQARAIEGVEELNSGPKSPPDHPDGHVGDSLAERHPRREGETIAEWVARLGAAGHSGISLGPPVDDPASPCLEGLHDLRKLGDGFSRCKTCELTIPDALAEMSA